jgi:Flp pilus assembly protein TadG
MRQRGAEIVEFLLVVPFMLIILFLLIELGLGFVNHVTLANASRAAVREAIMCDDPTDQANSDCEDAAKAAADAATQSMILLRDSTNVPEMDFPFQYGCTFATGDIPPAGCPITATMRYDFQFFLLPAFLAVTDFELSASTTMVKILD